MFFGCSPCCDCRCLSGCDCHFDDVFVGNVFNPDVEVTFDYSLTVSGFDPFTLQDDQYTVNLFNVTKKPQTWSQDYTYANSGATYAGDLRLAVVPMNHDFSCRPQGQNGYQFVRLASGYRVTITRMPQPAAPYGGFTSHPASQFWGISVMHLAGVSGFVTIADVCSDGNRLTNSRYVGADFGTLHPGYGVDGAFTMQLLAENTLVRNVAGTGRRSIRPYSRGLKYKTANQSGLQSDFSPGVIHAEIDQQTEWDGNITGRIQEALTVKAVMLGTQNLMSSSVAQSDSDWADY